VRRSEGKNRFFGNLWSTFAHTRLKTPWGNWTFFASRPVPLSSRRGEPPAVRRAVGAVACGDRNRPTPVPVLAPPFK
jgi:hypothetical protein